MTTFAKRSDVDAADKKRAVEKYGNVKYADPANKKYPIDTEEHIRAAWNYINKSKNAAKYTAGEVKSIKGKIVAAWKSKIDKAGPPSAKEMADMVQAKDFVIFRAGTWNGETFTEQDLDNMVASFNKDEAPHIIIGHSSDYKGKTRIPSFGQILGGLKRVGSDLIAVGAEFNEKLAHWIKEGFYNNRSVELSKDNKRILAVGMLGATPPAVEGMAPMDEALTEIAMEYSQPPEESKVLEFADAGALNFDELMMAITDDTFEECAERCQKFMGDIEGLLEDDDPDPYDAQNAVYALQNDLQKILGIHSVAATKIESVKQGFAEKVAEMAKKLFNHKSHEVGMDAAKEKELTDTIKAQDAKIKEFAEKERVATEARTKAEKEAADTKLKSEIKEFCDSLRKEGKYVKADDDAGLPDEMFKMATAGIDYKKVFNARGVIVPAGEHEALAQQQSNDVRPKVILDAKQYVKDNPKQFVGMDVDAATARAVYLHATGEIKFAGE